jgi:hypothetical protein
MGLGSISKGLTYVEITPVKVDKNAGGGVWENWDLSASIPTGAVYAEIWCRASAGVCDQVGVRKDGSALVRYAQPLSLGGGPTMTVGLNATRIVEVYNPVVNQASYTCFGYWA